MEQEIRKQAIQRYRNNEKPKSIYTDESLQILVL